MKKAINIPILQSANPPPLLGDCEALRKEGPGVRDNKKRLARVWEPSMQAELNLNQTGQVSAIAGTGAGST
jgi:hypothetical protein